MCQNNVHPDKNCCAVEGFAGLMSTKTEAKTNIIVIFYLFCFEKRSH